RSQPPPVQKRAIPPIPAPGAEILTETVIPPQQATATGNGSQTGNPAVLPPVPCTGSAAYARTEKPSPFLPRATPTAAGSSIRRQPFWKKDSATEAVPDAITRKQKPLTASLWISIRIPNTVWPISQW